MKWKTVAAGSVAVTTPTLSSITPNTGAAGTAVPVTIAGTGFSATDTTLVIGAPGVTAGALVITSTQITTTLTIAASAAIGAVSIYALNTNTNGSALSATGLTFTVTGQTQFTDYNGRADQPYYFGDQWYTTVVEDGGGTSGANLALLINVSATNLVLGDVGTNASTVFFAGIPQPIYPPSILTKAQYAQLTFKGGVNGGVATGPAVFMTPNNLSGYMARTFNTGANTRRMVLLRNLGSTSVVLAGGAGLYNIVVNDVVKLVVTPSAGSNDVSLYINGVLQVTVTDSNALRPTQGIFGIAHNGTTNATDTWNSFIGDIV